jgi:hypothetical protein
MPVVGAWVKLVSPQRQDANSAFWNPCENPLQYCPGRRCAYLYPWLKDLGLEDVYLASLAGYYKLDEFQAISTSLSTLTWEISNLPTTWETTLVHFVHANLRLTWAIRGNYLRA